MFLSVNVNAIPVQAQRQPLLVDLKINVMKNAILIIGLMFALISCGKSEDWMLQWYPRGDTDYGELTPGFSSLDMCRRAGAGKTIAALGGLATMVTPDGLMTIPPAKAPYFECMKECRPMREGGYLLQCGQIEAFKGEAAINPH